MKTASQTGGLTYNGATSIRREIPIIQSFPAFIGRVKSLNLSTYFRSGTAGTHSVTIVVFKTFNSPGSWSNSGAHWYQTPSNTSKYLTSTSYCGNILAQKTIDITFSGAGNAPFSADFATSDLTEYGKVGANWGGDVMIAAIKSDYSTDLLWGNATQSTLTVNYNNGVIKYGVGGAWVDCEVYYGSNGAWTQVQPYYGSGGAWVEIGG